VGQIRFIGQRTQAVQEVLADRKNWVEDVTQQLKGIGTQRVKISDKSVGKRMRQTKI